MNEPKPSAEALEVAKWLDAATRVVPQLSRTRMSVPRDVVVMLCTAYLEGKGDSASAPANTDPAYEYAVETKAGYADAFYEIGRMLGLPAMSMSPAEAFRTVMKPKLRELMIAAQRAPASVPAATGDAVRALPAKWRTLAIDLYYKKDEPVASDMVDDCADELEAALSADKASWEVGK